MFHQYKKGIFLALITIWVGSSIARGAGIDDPTFLQNTASVFSLVLDVIYVILWPLLIIAGWALDNTLVLGEVFHLDKALWQFWVIVRNLANFALGFIVIWMIAKHLWGQGSEKEIIGTIGKALVAGIGIQVSWFLMIALLDISTIAIYSIGAMPLQVLPNDSSSHRIIQPVITMNNVGIKNNPDNSQNDDEFFTINYTCGGDELNLGTYTTTSANNAPVEKPKVMQECLIHNNYIIARRPDKTTGLDEETKESINFNYCVANNYIYTVNDVGGKNLYTDNTKRYYIPLMNQDADQTPATFTGHNSFAGGFTGVFTDEQNWKYMPQIDALGKNSDGKLTESYNEQLGCPTFKDMQDKAQGMAGVMTTMFASLMQFGSINTFTNNDSLGRLSVAFFIRALVGIMLLAPLVVLAISLIKRVGYLWIALIGSPLVILFKTFGKDIGVDTKSEKLKMLDLGEVIGLIFMPVATIFALSIGIVFLSTLQSTIQRPVGDEQSAIFDDMGIQHTTIKEGITSCYNILITDICYESDGVGGNGWGNFLDFFSWIIVQLFGMGILWMIVFASFKASSVSSKLGEDVSKLAQNLVLSAPIVPFPGSKSGVGLGALGVGNNGGIINTATQKFKDKINSQRVGLFDNNTPPKGSGTGSATKGTPAPLQTALGSAITQSITNANGTVGVDSIQNALNNAGSVGGINTAQIQEIETAINDSVAKRVSLAYTDTNNQSTNYLISKENDAFVVQKEETSNNNENLPQSDTK